MADSNLQVIEKFIEAGLDEKQAKLIIDLATQPPSKASEIGKRVGISRMDAYNSLKSKNQLSFQEKLMLQELTYFVGIQEFNNKNFQSSIKFFKESIQAAENDKLMSAAKIWLADAYFQTQEFELAKDIYSQSLIVGDSFLTSLKLYNEACYKL